MTELHRPGCSNCTIADWTIEQLPAEIPLPIELDARSGAYDN